MFFCCSKYLSPTLSENSLYLDRARKEYQNIQPFYPTVFTSSKIVCKTPSKSLKTLLRATTPNLTSRKEKVLFFFKVLPSLSFFVNPNACPFRQSEHKMLTHKDLHCRTNIFSERPDSTCFKEIYTHLSSAHYLLSLSNVCAIGQQASASTKHL